MNIPKRYQHLPEQFAIIMTKVSLHIEDELDDSEYVNEQPLKLSELEYLKQLEIESYNVELSEDSYEDLPYFFLAESQVRWWGETGVGDYPVEDEEMWFSLLQLKDAYEDCQDKNSTLLDRLQTEKNELVTNNTKLGSFFEKDAFQRIDSNNQQLLRDQYAAQCTLIGILSTRLTLLEK